ncbi:DUF1573 domain-containing protein [Urechidicola vernalis]|uniref:DUF1573 domain-containing protein n=1 Tax=Urechidicola vernalis TaxID=3075600 RepID=A0ABU2Y6R8_9FLAO|nr:DUF1573 domain-containing protein [Urechidicola sp. P050]MDT0553891.1 DUF1573 domain-containing protein [Urechidicola sp. P050]
MRKFVLVLVAVAMVSFTSCKNENASAKVKSENVEAAAARDAEISKGVPVIEWNKTEHDFGNLKQGEKVETTFTLTNTGEGDLVITGARGSCGCTVPVWPKEAVKPGETAEIKVAFNSTGKKNKTTNTVTLTTNTEKGNEIVRIKAFVQPKEAAQ